MASPQKILRSELNTGRFPPISSRAPPDEMERGLLMFPFVRPAVTTPSVRLAPKSPRIAVDEPSSPSPSPKGWDGWIGS